MPSRAEVSTVSRTASMPARWPSTRGRCRLRGPPAVAVHDDGDVPRQPVEIDAPGERVFGRSRAATAVSMLGKGHGRDSQGLAARNRSYYEKRLGRLSIAPTPASGPLAGAVCPAGAAIARPPMIAAHRLRRAGAGADFGRACPAMMRTM